MPNGYLVTLGDGVLDAGDTISGALITFTTSQTLGAGSWTWSGNWTGDGNYYSNITDTGNYFLATDGNTYFVPTNWTVDPIDTASVTIAPVVNGTALGETIDEFYTDADGTTLQNTQNDIEAAAGDDTINTNGTVDGSVDNIDAGKGNDTVNSGAGEDTIYGRDGADTISAGADSDTVYGGSGNDIINGGDGADELFGEGGSDTIDGGAGDDTIDGGAGADVIDGGEGADEILGGAGDDEIAGGDDNDIIYGDGSAGAPVSGVLSWIAEGPDDTNLGTGFTQNANGIEVTVNIIDLGGLNNQAVSTSTQYVGAEGFDTQSSLQLGGDANGGAGVSQTAEIEFNFAAAVDSGLNDQVENVQFRINDIDQSSWDDYVTVLAFDSANVAIPVTLTLDGDETMLDADTVDGAGNDQPADIGGSVLVTVAGPVDRIEVIYENAGNGGQALWITDMHFDASVAPSSSNDTISGDEGDDTVYAGEGNDEVYGGSDNDTIDGDGGDDTIYGDSINFDPADYPSGTTGAASSFTFVNTAPVDVQLGWIDSTGTIQLFDVVPSGGSVVRATSDDHNWVVLDATSGAPLEYLGAQADGATVTFDSLGNDTLNGGEGNDTIYAEYGNDTIDGGAGQDTIYAGRGDDTVTGGADDDIVYLGDGNDDFGDFSTEDGNDTIYGEGGNDTINAGDGIDTLYGGDGDDTLIGASGNDTVYGGFGSDVLLVTDDHESDILEGGEDLDGTDFDQVVFSNFETTDGVTVTFSGEEAGSYDFDSTVGDGTFIEIEQVGTTSGDDTVDASVTTQGVNIYTNEGADTVEGGSGDDVVLLGSGTDTIDAGEGDDYLDLGGDGSGNPDGDADLVMMSDGDGNDTLANFDAPTDNGNGTYNGIDGIDVSDLTDANGNPVNTGDISVSENGDGDAVWTFPGGETLTFVGLGIADVGSPAQMVAMGVPADGIVSGDATGNVINAGYTGDPDGDMVDNGDALLAGEVGDDDIIEAGGGSDIVTAGAGNDEVFGDLGITTGLDSEYQSNSGTSGSLTGTNGQPNTTYTVSSGTGTVNISSFSSITNGYRVANNGDGGTANETYTHAYSQEVAGAQINFAALGINEELQITLDGVTMNLTDAIASGVVSLDDAGTYEINADGNLVLSAGGSNSNVGTLTINQPFTTLDVTGISTNGTNISGIVYDVATDTNPPVVEGNDTIDGGAGNDEIYGHGGNDALEGGTGDDTIDGGEGDDDIWGDAGDDTLSGGAGNDEFRFEAGFGTDTVVGGEDGENALGDTIYGFYGNDFTVTMSGDEAGTLSEGANSATFSEIERIVTNAGADTVDLTGDTSGMDVHTGSNDDTVISGAGNDDIDTSNGSDTVILNEGFGVDSIDGGANDDLSGDTLDASNMTSDVDVIFSAIEDGTLTEGGNVATFLDMENLITGSGDDTIDATLDNLGVDVVSGAGDDTLIGGTGIDTFDAGDGDDLFLINNNFGNDRLIGGEGDEIDGDVLDASNVTENLTLNLSNYDPNDPEDGSLGNGSDEIYFSEIETFILGSGADTAIGSTGADQIDLGSGADTVEGGEGNDQINLGEDGAGGPDGDADTIVLSDGDGNDTITNFDAPTANPDGTFNGIDMLDVSGLTSDGITPVHTGDVVVGDDGSGNAVLSFPGGESITLIGVAPAALDDRMALLAIGIPSDGIVSGTAAGETINTGYLGDPDGDQVDNNDAILPGETGEDDIIEAGAGDDNILGGLGDDEIYGESGDDIIQLETNFGDDTIDGGSTGETDGDTLIASSLTEDLTVTFSASEEGTVSGTSGTASFEEIEEIHTGSGVDIIDATLDSAGTTILAGAGVDTVTGGSGADTLFGEAGADDISGGAGDDSIDGGADDDTIDGDAGEDTLIGGSGNDTLDGGVDDDTLFGGTGDDTLIGGAGSDDMFGGDDADTFIGGIGDTVVGGEGGTDNDVLDVTAAGNTRVIYDSGDPESGTVEFLDLSGAVIGTMSFSEIETVNFVPCFTAQSSITTPYGEVEMRDLKVGDLVLTRDSGFKAIQWIGSTTVEAKDNLAPIHFEAGALGNNTPMLISPQHRVLLTGWKAEILFGASEVLASAHSLVNGRTITVQPSGEIEYFHMMFDRHEIVLSDKAWTESFHPGDVAMNAMAQSARDEILSLFPELAQNAQAYGETARLVIKPHEARAFAQEEQELCQV